MENAVYTGVLEQGKRAKVSYKVKREIQVPEAEWIRVENAHEPIISRQDYEAVQILLQRDMRAVGKGAFSKENKIKDSSRISKKNGRGKSGIAESGEDGSGQGGLEDTMAEKCAYKYAGLLFCGDCGMSMVKNFSSLENSQNTKRKKSSTTSVPAITGTGIAAGTVSGRKCWMKSWQGS